MATDLHIFLKHSHTQCLNKRENLNGLQIKIIQHTVTASKKKRDRKNPHSI